MADAKTLKCIVFANKEETELLIYALNLVLDEIPYDPGTKRMEEAEILIKTVNNVKRLFEKQETNRSQNGN
jgi:hypothetical protein